MDRQITYAYLETTNHCNLNCSFCNRDSVVKSLKHMSIEGFNKLILEIKDHPLKTVKLMGMGEPFFHPKFDEICRIFKENFPDTHLISATNCQYKMNSVFKESLKYIDMLYLSIDGFGDNYEKNRPPAKWGKLLRFLNEIKTINRYDCKIFVNYIVNPSNVEDISKINEFIDEYDLVDIRLNMVQNWSETEETVVSYSADQLQYLKSNWGDKIVGKSIWDYEDCFWPKEGLYVTVDGDVKMCCMNTSTNSFGNVFDSPINSIRESRRFMEVKDGCKQNTPTSHCSNCSYKELTDILLKVQND